MTLPACTLPSLPSFFVLSPLNGVSAPCNKFKSKTVCRLSSPATPVHMHILCFVSAGYLQTNILRRCDALPALSHHFQRWADFHHHHRLSHSVCEWWCTAVPECVLIVAGVYVGKKRTRGGKKANYFLTGADFYSRASLKISIQWWQIKESPVKIAVIIVTLSSGTQLGGVRLVHVISAWTYVWVSALVKLVHRTCFA